MMSKKQKNTVTVDDVEYDVDKMEIYRTVSCYAD